MARAAAFAGITDILGADPRLYFEEMPQNVTYPAGRYGRIGDERPSCMGVDAGLVRARFQFDAYAETQKAARLLVEQYRLCFQRWSNASGTVVQDTFVISSADLGLDPDVRVYHSSIDF